MEDQGKRILIFVVAAAAIFFAWQWLFPGPKKEPPKPPVPPGQQHTENLAKLSSVWGELTPGPSPAAEEVLTLRSNEVQVDFTNVGGVVKNWVVLYDDVKGRVMNEHLFAQEIPGLGLGAVNFSKASTINKDKVSPTALWVLKDHTDRELTYTFTSPEIEIEKHFTLVPDANILKLRVSYSIPKLAEAPADPKAAPARAEQDLVVSLFGHGLNEASGGRRGKVPTGAACYIGGGVSTTSAHSLANNAKLRGPGVVRWGALAHRYDLIAIAPRDADGLECNAYTLSGVKDGVDVDLVFPHATVNPGDPPQVHELVMYVGPKYLDKLEDADHVAGFSTHFRDVIDLGWFSIIAKPMLWILHKLYDVVGNWGIAIILLTVMVKLATLYWTTKSMRSMKAMAALRPEIEAIQKKYPDDKQKQQQAQMDLFKQHGVSPLSGCLPMLLQMPIWLALYKMLSVAGELHLAVFIPGWLNDLTARDPYYIIPLTLTGLMFVQSRIQPSTGDSMQQKVLQYGMPLMFGFMGLYFPSGLGVYMLTNTMLGITHSLYMRKTDKTRKAAAAPVKAAEKVELPRAEVVRRGEPAAASGDDDRDDSDAGEGDEADDSGDEAEDAKSAAPASGAKSNGVRRSQRNKRRGKRR